MENKKIRGWVVPYCLLNYKKKIDVNEWEYDYGAWNDCSIPKDQRKKFYDRASFDLALSIYDKLLRGYRVKAKDLIVRTQYGKDSMALFDQMTMNFPEIYQEKGNICLNWNIKKEREYKSYKEHYSYVPWRLGYEM